MYSLLDEFVTRSLKNTKTKGLKMNDSLTNYLKLRKYMVHEGLSNKIGIPEISVPNGLCEIKCPHNSVPLE